METWMASIEWLRDLDPVFAFLLALPFAVGALGLLAHRERRQPRRAAERTHGAAGAHAR